MRQRRHQAGEHPCTELSTRGTPDLPVWPANRTPRPILGHPKLLRSPPPFQQNALVYELLCVVSVNVFSYLELWDKYE